MEDWVRAWLEEQRRKGEKCLEIKYIQNKPYVYRSTSVYDKTTKSPKKVSTYLGRLTKEAGLIPKGSRGSRPLHSFRTVREYGNAALMTEEFTDLLPVLQDAFPDYWQELVVLTFTGSPVTHRSRGLRMPGRNSTTSLISNLTVTPAPFPGY